MTPPDMNPRTAPAGTAEPQRILVTGASSGLGAALAEHYARRYGASATLGLLARRSERLAELAARLAPTGARVLTYAVDVRERTATTEAVRDFDAACGGCTLAIAGAGMSRGDRILQGDPAGAADVIQTNVNGVLHTLVPLVPGMVQRRRGHLVGISSVAGFRGLPGKGAYSASKASVRFLMDAWRPQLRPHGVRVTAICPGWFVSELTENNPYPMPFMLDLATATRLTARAIDKGRATYVFPLPMRIAAAFIGLVPERLMPMHATRS